jgi:lipopolysaccharide export system permease protein
MRLVERYVFRQAGFASLAGFFALTGVVWVTESLRQVDLLTTKGQTLLIFLALTGLTLPSLAAIVAPIALFIGVVFTLNRMNSDSELVVLNASGVSPGRLIRPFLVLSFATALATGALTLWATPASLSEVGNLLMKIRADFLTRVIREGTFAELDQGFVFHYHERAPDGSLRGIFIEDRRDPQHVNIYLARKGETSARDAENFLILENGMIQRSSDGGAAPATVSFVRYAIDLAQFSPAGDGNIRKPKEQSTLQLLRPDPKDPNAAAFRSELNSRLAAPLYALALGLIGFASQQKSQTTRNARGASIAAASVFALVLRGAGFWAAALSQKHAEALFIVYGLPLVGVAGACASVFGVFDSIREGFARESAARTPGLQRSAT